MDKNSNISVGIQTSTFMDWKHPDIWFKMISDAGFDCIDLNLDQLFNLKNLKKRIYDGVFFESEEDAFTFLEPVKNFSEKYNIKINQIHSPLKSQIYEFSDVLNEKLVDAAKRTLCISRWLNCDYVVIHPFFINYMYDTEDEFQANYNFFDRLYEEAVKYNVTICIENIFTKKDLKTDHITGSSPESLCRLIDKLNCGREKNMFAACLDTGHANIMNYSLNYFIETLGSRLKVLHISENNSFSDEHINPFSYSSGMTSFMDWNGFCHALNKIGYSGALSFETFKAVRAYPEALIPVALRTTYEIGKYFSSRIHALKNIVIEKPIIFIGADRMFRKFLLDFKDKADIKYVVKFDKETTKDKMHEIQVIDFSELPRNISDYSIFASSIIGAFDLKYTLNNYNISDYFVY